MAFNLDYCIHAANILLLAAYSVRDILWLRLFAVASSVIAMPYFLFQPKPLWAAFGWSALFTGINLFQTWRLFVERRPVKLSAEEETVRRLVFEKLPPREALRVIGLGTWSTSTAGERLLVQGEAGAFVSLIVEGTVQVKKDGRVLGSLGRGEIVGSSLLLSGGVAEVDALAVDHVRAVRWEIVTLEGYLEAHPETRNAFQRHLARDLAGKLKRMANTASTLAV